MSYTVTILDKTTQNDTVTAQLHISDGTDTYRWSLGGIPSDADVQTYADDKAAQMFRQAAEKRTPLTTEQIGKQRVRHSVVVAAESVQEVDNNAADYIENVRAEVRAAYQALGTEYVTSGATTSATIGAQFTNVYNAVTDTTYGTTIKDNYFALIRVDYDSRSSALWSSLSGIAVMTDIQKMHFIGATASVSSKRYTEMLGAVALVADN
jgi:hypothetical protein